MFLPLAGGLLLALASVAEAAAAPPAGPPSVGYADAGRHVEVRLSTAGRFMVSTPNGTCAGETAPVADLRRRRRVVGGGVGCVVDFTTDRRGARGWVLLPAEPYHFNGPYLRIEFEATGAPRAATRPVPRPARAQSARRSS
jgi:hypothetical protein